MPLRANDPYRVHPEYTQHLVGAPERHKWPLVPIVGVLGTSVIAAAAFIFMLIGMLSIPG